MRKIPPAEWFLSQDIGPERASAIMGDLEELAVARGRIWFWVAYVRALISLGWRTGGSAFILAFESIRFTHRAVRLLVMDRRAPHLMEAGLFGENYHHAQMIFWNISLVASQFLLFAFPFVFIRFGPRNRLTRLTFALFLVAVPIYSLRPWVMDLSGVLSALALGASVTFPHWRKPAAVLAATFFAAGAVKVTCLFLLSGIYHQNMFVLPASKETICDAISFALAAMVCIRCHNRLLGRRPPGGVDAQPA